MFAAEGARVHGEGDLQELWTDVLKAPVTAGVKAQREELMDFSAVGLFKCLWHCVSKVTKIRVIYMEITVQLPEEALHGTFYRGFSLYLHMGFAGF